MANNFLLISNIGAQQWAISTVHPGSRGIPIMISLKPAKAGKKSFENILLDDVKQYSPGVKMQIADGMRLGVIQVNEMEGVHTGVDMGLVPATATPASDEEILIESCIDFKVFYNTHAASTAWHSAPSVNLIATADPINIAQVYTFIGAAIATYNLHIAEGVHNTIDITNLMPLGVPATPSDASVALKRLWALLQSHKKFVYNGSPPKALTPAEVINL